MRDTASLEIPAGKLDVAGEPPLETAKRELVEEIGKEAGAWRELYAFWVSPGFSDERVWLYLATDLRDAPGGAAPEENERIEIVPVAAGAAGRGDRGLRGLEIADRAAVAAQRPSLSVSLSRSTKCPGQLLFAPAEYGLHGHPRDCSSPPRHRADA